MTTRGMYDRGPKPAKRLGHRLSNPRDPAVRLALKRQCPTCNAKPDQWCVGVAENSRTKGRTITRIHVARATFKEQP
ncbi:zinc finger domain-containing protein [Mycolicibacterium psychrotolerans]|uniref:zinc finger domain-containing protein n=1 Tax=Mycolicibacterium psychrotolerans TaxID=216929 RepID=UPI003D67992C